MGNVHLFSRKWVSVPGFPDFDAAVAQPAPSVPAGHQVGEEAAVLAALDRYVNAISAKDLRTMAAMQMPDGMTYVARPREGTGIEIIGRPNACWVDPVRACAELRPEDTSQLRPED